MSKRTSWLELLLADASAAELDTHRLAQLAAATTPAERTRVEREALRALQLQSQLRDRARRVAELAALSQVAARLTSVRDLPSLLDDIAVQARQLLRSEVAYLALVVDDGSLRIKHFDGVLDPSITEIAVPTNAGLAGKIVSTGRAFWTSDYLNDRSIEHAQAADDLADGERLHSILGVPLWARGGVIGVLFAAERSRRPFADSEVDLLAGLASHAAVAVENARLFAAERASASGVARAVALHERLTETAVRGGGPAEVVRALAEVLDVPVQFVNAQDDALGGDPLDVGGEPPSIRFRARDARRTVVAKGSDGSVTVLTPVVAADEYLGALAVAVGDEADDALIRLLERSALALALSLVQERAVTEAAARSQGELLAAMVDGGDPDVLDRRAGALRVDLSRLHVVALIEPIRGHDASCRGVAAEIARRGHGLVVDRAARTLLLVPVDADLVPLTNHATVGVSEPMVGAASVPAAAAAARRCLDAALALGRLGFLARAETLGIYRFLLSTSGPGEVDRFVRRAIGPLLDHDAERGTDLAATLEAYLSSGRQHATTAEQLHIHANTLYQRLARIGAVLGDDWREADRALDLHVALRLHRLAGSLH